jgi:hypothetical protein
LAGEFADFGLHERCGDGSTESVITRKVEIAKRIKDRALTRGIEEFDENTISRWCKLFEDFIKIFYLEINIQNLINSQHENLANCPGPCQCAAMTFEQWAAENIDIPGNDNVPECMRLRSTRP